MNWRNPLDEKPKSGQVIWCMYKHWKESGALGYQIMAGEVEYDRNGDWQAQSGDWTGQGSWAVKSRDYSGGEDECIAWLPESELEIPKFAKER